MTLAECDKGSRRRQNGLHVENAREILRLRVPAGNHEARFPEEGMRDAPPPHHTQKRRALGTPAARLGMIAAEIPPLKTKGGAPVKPNAREIRNPGSHDRRHGRRRGRSRA
jgi:hypothetical protein